MRVMIAALLFASAPTLAATADDNPAPMDLVWDATDVNGVALNPKKKEIITVGGNGFQTFLLPDFFKPFKKPGTTQP